MEKELEILGDDITKLPIDKEPVNINDVEMIQKIFSNNETQVISIIDDLKEPAMIAFVVILLSLPIINSVVCKVFPYINNETYMGAIVKGIIVGLVLWLMRLQTKR
jgi:hypothetical protein